MTTIVNLFNDYHLFWLLQFTLVVLVVVSFFITKIDKRYKKETMKGGVTRGDKSMAIFFGSYATINGILVALCLSVNSIEHHRTFWVLLDTMISIYLCLINPWFREGLIKSSHYISKIEQVKNT